VEKEANLLKERLTSLEIELAQLSANQQAATDNLEQMAKSADVCDRSLLFFKFFFILQHFIFTIMKYV